MLRLGVLYYITVLTFSSPIKHTITGVKQLGLLSHCTRQHFSSLNMATATEHEVQSAPWLTPPTKISNTGMIRNQSTSPSSKDVRSGDKYIYPVYPTATSHTIQKQHHFKCQDVNKADSFPETGLFTAGLFRCPAFVTTWCVSPVKCCLFCGLCHFYIGPSWQLPYGITFMQIAPTKEEAPLSLLILPSQQVCTEKQQCLGATWKIP